MNKHQHSDDLIKKKIDEHEFDFQDRAWDKMNDLLDDSSTMPRRKAFLFFNRNKWIFMIILFLIIGMTAKTVFFPAPNANVEQTFLSVTPNEQITQAVQTKELEEKETEKIIKNNEKKTYPITQSYLITKKSNKLITKPLQLTENTDTKNYINLSKDNFKSPFAQPLFKDTWQLFNFPITDAPPTEKVYLHLDRTMYKPGEAIWFSAYLRSRGLENTSDVVYVDFIAPNGNIEKSLTLVADNGQATGDILIPQEAVGGSYKIKAYTNWQRNFDDAFERTVQVQKAVLPNLRMELKFARKAYSANDEVVAKLDLKDLANAALSNHNFKYTASLDGNNIKTLKGKTDEKGIATLKFSLPQNLKTNNGLVNVMIEYNGQTESIARPIPIVLNQIDLQFLPEGGGLVANLESKVAFKAIDEFGQPADISGTVKDESGKVITTFRSYHQGMGAFDFIPQHDKTYYATITQPQNIEKTYLLPKAEHSGVVMQVTHKDKTTLKVKISTSNTTQPHQLTIQGYGKTYLTKSLASQQFQTIEIPTDDLPLGIVAVTLTNKSETPIAERLVFVNPHKQLNVAISTNKKKYLPREKVQMNVRITDEQAQPVKGQFSLSVVDDKLLSYTDDKQGHILSYLLLESELKGSIEEPNFYFEPKEKHPEKDQQLALDYLMLTQGWRRFDYVSDVESFANQQQFADSAMLASLSNAAYNETLRIIEIPAEYETVTEQVVVKPATTKWVKRKADEKALAKNPDIKEVWCLVEVPAEYETVTKTKLKKAAYQRIEAIPVEYETVTKQVLVQPAQDGKSAVYKTVTEQVIENKATPTIAETLQGRVAGVQITPSSDKNDVSTNIRIRGYLSISDKKPLYVVDGVPQKSIDKSLNPDDIEEISVLKDKSATAIYGVRGANGVVIITTKDAHRNRKSKGAEKRFQKQLEEQLKTNQTTYQEQIWAYQNYYAESIAALQAGKLTNHDVEFIQNKLNEREIALKESANILEIIGDLAKKEVDTDYEKIDVDELVRTYEYANNFKKGFYQSRKFYAPKYEAPIISNERTDFRSTIYWQPTLDLNDKGETTVEFYNSDAITTFRAVVEGIGNNSAIGRGTQTYYAQMPFGMTTKLPTVIMTGDLVKIPVTLSNHTDKAITGQLTATVPSNFVFQEQSYPKVTLEAKESKTIFLAYDIKSGATTDEISVQFQAGEHQDAISETVTLLEKGFPVEEVYAGKSLEKSFEIDIHKAKKGTLQAQFTAYPSVLNDMAESAERMFRQPTGCFEQTTSKNYPNLLALSYLKATKQLDPTLENKAYKFLDKGYKRLLTFEVKDKEDNLGGFDWYGKPPAHEGLTAYGLMQFVDMQAVYPVDQALIDRTATWLLNRKDGKGSWKREGKWRFGNAIPDISDAYIVWAMTEAGYGDQISLELETAYQKAVQSKDAYRLALLTNALQKQNDVRANRLLNTLLAMQKTNGSWATKQTFVRAYGKSAAVETTALVTLAMLNAVTIGEDGSVNSELSNRIEKAIQFLASAKNQYGFGSTQSTILAMKALINYAQYTTNNSTQNGVIVLLVDDKVVAELPYFNNQVVAIQENLVPYLKAGKQTVTVKFEGVDKALAYDVALNYQTDEPRSDAECKVRLKTTLNQKQVKQGEIVRLTTTITNTTAEDLPNTIAIVGIPSGLSLQPWQLKELQEKEAFDYYELLDGYIVFHYRGLAADAVRTVHLDLKADLKGNYTAPASSSYLYYVNEFVDWSTPLSIEIQ